MAVPPIQLKKISSLWDLKGLEETNSPALWFEFFEQDQGFAKYSTLIPNSKNGGKLYLDQYRDFATVYYNGVFVKIIN